MIIERELAELRRMTPKQLRERYHEVFGERSRSGNKGFLIKRIVWRLQAIEEGDLSERARKNPSPRGFGWTLMSGHRCPQKRSV